MIESAKALPKLKKRQLTPNQLSLSNQKFGLKAEHTAQDFLTQNGYKVIETNVACGKFEVDIIAWDTATGELVFIEVKSRQTGYFGDPSRAVDKLKLSHMKYVAKVYRELYKHQGDYRFDVVAVLPNQVEHFVNVTWQVR